jgi:hypothetical protein
MSAPASPSPETRQSPSGQTKPSAERPLISPAGPKQTGNSPPMTAGEDADVYVRFREMNRFAGATNTGAEPPLAPVSE